MSEFPELDLQTFELRGLGQERHLILCRFDGELSVKKKAVRFKMQRLIVRNLQEAFSRHKIDFKIVPQWSRIFVIVNDLAACDLVRRCFGLSSYSLVEGVCETDFERIVTEVGGYYGQKLQGKRFAVKSKRVGATNLSTSLINGKLGEKIFEQGNPVDLSNPQALVRVEMYKGITLYFSQVVRCVGGFPSGFEGRAVVLFSGGFDSPVAAFEMAKRGIRLDFVFCNLGSKAHERSVIKIAKEFSAQWIYGYQPRIVLVDFRALAAEILKKVAGPFVGIVLKRFFYRAAQEVAAGYKADAITTGEVVGQVSSQTLANLKTIEQSVDLPVMRPLLTYLKQEIIALSKKIDCFESSQKVTEYCQISNGKPCTLAPSEKTLKQEARVDCRVFEEAMAGAVERDLTNFGMKELVDSHVWVETPPKDSQLIDCRSQREYDRWHPAGALRVECDPYSGISPDSLKAIRKDGPLVLYCPYGLVSTLAAEKLQDEGFEAYSVRGGTKALASWQESINT